MQQINTVQYLRGLAALGVLIFHVSERYNLGFDIGAAGVDLFFVISGVIMWVTTDRSRVTPEAFISRRIRRVVPLYWLVTAVTFVALCLKPDFFFEHDGSWHNLFYSLAFLPSPETGLHPVVVQGWTLTYEMGFYLIFAATLVFKGTVRLLSAIAVLTGLVVVSTMTSSPYLAIAGNPVILEFGAGLLIGFAWCRSHLLSVSVATTVALCAVVTIAVSPYLAGDIHRALKFGLPAALLVYAMVSLEGVLARHPFKPLLLLGNASYSLYLWHVLFGVVILAVLLRSGLPKIAFAPIEIGGALGLSLLAYGFIEKPMQAYFSKKRKTAGLAAETSAVA
ncbi:acyltransferase [Rhizobium sp. BE258]|uniref:acyltransferase family protein n=1 Tax=Rhizobium sp. BE258 TaxID=2817722 RepID=UPI0028571ECA|nr:acyltransferase [Rhizobium sp. BE258]MDR7145315.1 exopolysaccharide production protein ExoZ [Rhizobium sp. BE258]